MPGAGGAAEEGPGGSASSPAQCLVACTLVACTLGQCLVACQAQAPCLVACQGHWNDQEAAGVTRSERGSVPVEMATRRPARRLDENGLTSRALDLCSHPETLSPAATTIRAQTLHRLRLRFARTGHQRPQRQARGDTVSCLHIDPAGGHESALRNAFWCLSVSARHASKVSQKASCPTRAWASM